MLDIGLLHHLEKLPRVGAEALDIAPLPLGIDGIEREARLAAAGQAGDHDQLFARQFDIHALEIMLAGAFYFDVGQTHANALQKMPERVQRAKRTGWSALYVQCLFCFQCLFAHRPKSGSTACGLRSRSAAYVLARPKAARYFSKNPTISGDLLLFMSQKNLRFHPFAVPRWIIA